MLNPIRIGIVCIRTTKRNVLFSLVDFSEKKVKFSSSLKCVKYGDNDRKGSYVSVRAFSEFFTRKMIELGYTDISIIFRGLGVIRIALVHAIRDSSLKLTEIKDETLSSHNGCRPAKQRRKKIRTRISFRTKKLLSPRV